MADQSIVIEFLEATHRRHLWPRRPKVHDDELLSSWIWRLATHQGVAPRDFLSLVPCGHQGTAMDLTSTAADLRFLAARSGNSFETLFNAMLLPPPGFLIANDTVNLHAALVRYGRLLLRTQSGRPVLQFCPSCLAAGAYFRKDWRFAHLVACPQHKRQLLDRCPACGGTIDLLEQRSVGRRALCPSCRYDLSHAEAPDGIGALKTQQRLAELLDFLINRGARTALMRDVLTKIRGLPQALAGRPTPLSQLGVAARANVFHKATPRQLSQWIVGTGDLPEDRWHRLILDHGSVDVLAGAGPRRRAADHSAASAAPSPEPARGARTAARAGSFDSSPAASSLSRSGRSRRLSSSKRDRKTGVVT